ncbi:excinuclease ABC subunit UvrC [Hansschlegelia plantiphila]|uniref:UvrABC system protein C n=1 Tax=Hansschlegelia plantiphila TaxID=374655 RepID=A0A9W6J1R9_9HYPH|nr:excinuclease ABC subunit UvrC [Hansschlegelia plantiphila]GLK67808.1 UvrABC system protein C [Hansschlegelia plantiphila]
MTTDDDIPPTASDAVEEIDEYEPLPTQDADGEAAPENLRRGVEAIRATLKHLPNGPGVYRMFDANGDVLYVGKARSLKKRVTSYARGLGHNTRIARMIAETASMEFVSTETETEALLLEANLIKRLRPRFNVLMRDDKSFPYILLATDHPAPQISKHRGARVRKGDYYGPFASAGAVGRTIDALERAFLLRSCADSYYERRTRPCLLFQIKRCSGPCTGEIALDDYAELVGEARDFLSGKSDTVKHQLNDAMARASESLDFERAAVLRDRLAALAAIQSNQGVNPRTVEEADVFAIHGEGGQTCVEAFFYRAYQNWGARAYFPKADGSLEPREVLGSFLAQFYDSEEPPRLVLLSEEIEDRALLAEALTLRSGGRVEVSAPVRGEKKDLVQRALNNAREALGRRLAETSTQAKLLAGVAAAFGLPKTPQRIEVYDNSHIMGTAAVGGMIVSGPEGFQKNHYRKFNIRPEDLTPGDDTGMMRQVLRRRFARLQKESPRDGEGRAADDAPPWPDLVLIDGGQGQLTAARETLAELGVTGVPLVGIAKGMDREAGRETFFLEGKTPFRMPPRDPVLYYVQRLRDEAHRFAIGTHRARRSKEFVANPLDEVPGVGPTRKRALLRHFGTAKAVARAGVADLQKAPGVNRATAQTIYDFFHEKGDGG